MSELFAHFFFIYYDFFKDKNNFIFVFAFFDEGQYNS